MPTLLPAPASPDPPPSLRARVGAGLSAAAMVGAVLVGGLLGFEEAGVGVAVLVVLISLFVRRQGATALGLRRPKKSWRRTVGTGVAVGVGLQALSTFAVEPALTWLTGAPADLSAFSHVRGDAQALLLLLALTWGLVVWVEEGLFRGFLIPALRTLFGAGPRATRITVAVAALGFAFAHGYQGPTGLGASAVAGAVLGALFVREQERLWSPVIAHGVANTLALIALYACWL